VCEGNVKQICCFIMYINIIYYQHDDSESFCFAHDFALLIMLGYYGWPWEQGGESNEQIYYIAFSLIF
jgi:hypothetical protein